MFFLIPWRVDVPQDRWPVMNWLILLALVAVFAVQVRDRIEDDIRQDSRPRAVQPGTARPAPAVLPDERPPEPWSEIPGVSQDLILTGWSLRRLLGYMWLHGNLFHLLGNMLFLWIFGNALCAKLGNVRYLGLYVLFGVVAGIAQLLSHALPALGASGAINGVVGAYLVLFYQNEITCLFAFWLILPYVRWFAVSSVWMVLFWLFWDVVGRCSRAIRTWGMSLTSAVSPPVSGSPFSCARRAGSRWKSMRSPCSRCGRSANERDRRNRRTRPTPSLACG